MVPSNHILSNIWISRDPICTPFAHSKASNFITAEAVASLSLAANIFQFLDYGSKFVLAAWAICKSDPETIEAFTTLQSLSKNLRNIIAELRAIGRGPADLEPERAILAVATDCLSEAQLDGYHPTSSRKRDKIKATFKLIWTSNDIKALEAKFEKLKNLKAENEGVPFRLEKVEIDAANGRVGLANVVMDYLAGGPLPTQLIGQLEGQLLVAVRFAAEKRAQEQMIDMEPSKLSGLTMSPARRSRIQQYLLAKLRYKSIDDRAETVAEAHNETFRWIFEAGHPWVNLREWLESESQLYWVTAKAGSGNRRVPHGHEQPRCMQHLSVWSGNCGLAMASFYFWASGNMLQASKEGLYRTLLYQLMGPHPDLLEHVFPEQWDEAALFKETVDSFEVPELKRCLQRAVLLLTSIKKVKVCLFIDGLDEFDGDHDELVQYLEVLLSAAESRGHIKICVASRPWVVFGEAFIDRPSLRLEDLTFNDIQAYVGSRFLQERSFSLLLQSGNEFVNDLVREVVEKSARVFLWANLVVTSLLEGIRHGDRISDLRRRLDSLLPDLEDLYARIFDNIEPQYFEHAAQYFKLLEAYIENYKEPPTILFFSFADDEIEAGSILPDFNHEPSDVVLSVQSFINIRIDEMQRRLNSRCKGLMETTKSTNVLANGIGSGRVQCLHRTVEDYIKQPAVQNRLGEALKTPFDPRLRFCSASSRPKDHVPVDGRSLCRDLVRCVKHSTLVQDLSLSVLVQILDDIERVLGSRTEAQFIEILRHHGVKTHTSIDILLISSKAAIDLGAEGNKDITGTYWINFVINLGALRYLEARVSRLVPAGALGPRPPRSPFARLPIPFKKTEEMQDMQGFQDENRSYLSSLLSQAIPAWSDPTPITHIIDFLLEKGADVNETCTMQLFSPAIPGHVPVRLLSISAWQRVLAIIIWNFGHVQPGNLHRASPWVVLMKSMLEHGAEVSLEVVDGAVETIRAHPPYRLGTRPIFTPKQRKMLIWSKTSELVTQLLNYYEPQDVIKNPALHNLRPIAAYEKPQLLVGDLRKISSQARGKEVAKVWEM
ncbi:hypothetical protein V8F06_008879 [Rhypophila decipiens]